jgi:hypothetical protein
MSLRKSLLLAFWSVTRRYNKNRNSLNRHPTHRLLGALEP